MNFPQAMRQVLSRYADFSGRAMRSEYWWCVLPIILASVVFGMVDSALPYRLLQPTFGLSVLIPTLAVGARRLHDTGRSGWWMALWAGISLVFGAILALSVIMYASIEQNAGLEALGPFLFAFLGFVVSAPFLLATAIWSIIWMAQRGEGGPNRFGEDPRSES